MRFLVRALFTVLLATAAGAASVTGTVKSATGVALGNMVVTAYDATGSRIGQASTDTTGFYDMSLNAGDYRFLAYDPEGVYATSFDANAESFETTPLRTIPASGAQVSFILRKGGVITGKVQNAGGFSIDGAVVEVYNLSGTRRAFASTNDSGDYSIVVPPGEYKVVAYELTGAYAVTFHRSVRSFDEATPVHVAEGESASVFFNLGVAARVSGTALNPTMAAVPQILVYAYTPAGALVAKTTTDFLGSFRLSLPAGDYRFVAADARLRLYATAYYDRSSSFERSTIVTLAPGEQRDNIGIVMAPAAWINGEVNAPNLVVAAYNLDGTLHAQTTSEASGRYSLLVAPGEYRIAVSDPALTYATLFYGGTTDFRFAPSVSVQTNVYSIDVTLPRGGRVNGTVRDGSNSQTLARMTVVGYDLSGRMAGTASTNGEGRYALVLAPGAYRILAFDPRLDYATGYAGGAMSYETAAPLVIEAGAMITADLALRRAVRVSGLVTTSDGDLLTGIEVFALDAGGNRAAGATSRDGAFTIAVAPGSYRFVAVDPFRRYVSSETTLEFVIADGQPPPAILLTMSTLSRRRSVRH